ncbi:lytic murein transglycosylase, partial [Proteus terrae]
MFKYSFIAVIVSGLMLSACTNGQQKLAERQITAPFPAYVEALKLKAAQLGYKQETIDFAFSEAHFIERVIKSDRNQ